MFNNYLFELNHIFIFFLTLLLLFNLFYCDVVTLMKNVSLIRKEDIIHYFRIVINIIDKKYKQNLVLI